MTRPLRLRAKRGMDLGIATVGLLLGWPLLVVIALAVLSTSGRPILFRQVRAGQHGRPFTLVKFRTMRCPGEHEERSLDDGDRLTRFGAMLRRWSLDELPQLWNVLRGDLSVVGPRPLLLEYLPLYSAEQRRRHELRPGITGWAQVNGRNAIGWEERFALDVWYVDHWSLTLDCRILATTVVRVVQRRGISGDGTATMSRFRGSSS